MTRHSGVLAVVVVVVAGLLVGPAPAASTPTRATYYLSLGDSLAAGYQPIGSDPRAGGPQGYADQLYKQLRDGSAQLRLVKLGCGGETTKSMLDGQLSFCRYPAAAQLAQALTFLAEHPGEVALVTIDIGANDLIEDCAGDATCAVDQIGANLPVILADLHAQAGPDIPIVGMNYYQPGVAQWFTDPAGAHAAAGFAVAFNDMLEDVYAAAGVPVADVESAFAVTEFTTIVATKDVGSVPLSVANACAWTWICTAPPHGPDIHPTTAGYGVIAHAFLDAL